MSDFMPQSGRDREVVHADDEAAFAALAERYRHELRVHCYRMLGSFEDSEDLVQETFLRAWSKRYTFQGRSTIRAWLYRIATNACLDFLARHPRNPRRRPGTETAESRVAARPPDEIPWLQPYPDRLLDPTAGSDAEPDAVAVAKETMELVFLAAIQHLPPKQRAVLILRDVLGHPANETSEILESTVPSVNSALQRARATLKEHLPRRRMEWRPADDPTSAERHLLQRYMAVIQWTDADAMAVAMAELMSEDIRVTMPPNPVCFLGRETYLACIMPRLDPNSSTYFGAWRSIPTRANSQPAVAHYVRRPGDTGFRAHALEVLRVEEGLIAEITAFSPEVFRAFDLPQAL